MMLPKANITRGQSELQKALKFQNSRLNMALGCAKAAVKILSSENPDVLTNELLLQAEELVCRLSQHKLEDHKSTVETTFEAAKNWLISQNIHSTPTENPVDRAWIHLLQVHELHTRSKGGLKADRPIPANLMLHLQGFLSKVQSTKEILRLELLKTQRIKDADATTWTIQMRLHTAWGSRKYNLILDHQVNQFQN